MSKENNELAIFQQIQPLQIFKENKADDFLAGVEKEVEEFKKTRDISTPKGRAEIKAFSYKVAQTKAPMWQAGLSLTEEMRGKINKINAERERIAEKLQSFQDDVRQPLTDFENKEKERIKYFQGKIADLEFYKSCHYDIIVDSKTATEALNKLDEDYKSVSDWQEFATKAKNTFDDVNSYLFDVREDWGMKEVAAAELEKLRKEKEERDQKEREEQIRRGAAETAKQIEIQKAQKAEEAAQAEIYRLEAEKKAAQKARENAEIRVKENAKIMRNQREQAKIQAQKDTENAIKAEQARVSAVKEAEIKATKAREANNQHINKIQNEVIEAISNFDLEDREFIEDLVEAISRNKIPHLTIKY